MSSRSNVDILKASYAAFGRGDLSVLESVLAPEVRWEYAGPREIPWAGSFQGSNNVARFFQALAASAEIGTFEAQAFVADGDAVVVLGVETLRGKSTARTCETHWAHAYAFQGDRIVSFREYTDTAAVASVFHRTKSR